LASQLIVFVVAMWSRNGYVFGMKDVLRAAKVKLRVFDCDVSSQHVVVKSELRLFVDCSGAALDKPVCVEGPVYRAFVDASEPEFEKAREHAVLVCLRVWLRVMALSSDHLAPLPALSADVGLLHPFNVSKAARAGSVLLDAQAKALEEACTLCDLNEPANATMPCGAHTFCFSCVSAWWRKTVSEGRTELSCPMCRVTGTTVVDKTTGKAYNLPQWRLRSMPRISYNLSLEHAHSTNESDSD
jgi:hypothetical protein